MNERLCGSCEVVGIASVAVTTRNGEWVCQDCADEIDGREREEAGLREALELDEMCLDCGKRPAVKRQPYRGVWLCEECYAIDMDEVEEKL